VLVDSSDLKMLAEAMLKVACGKELAEEMGRNRKEGDLFMEGNSYGLNPAL
jgi:hypothetical protein